MKRGSALMSMLAAVVVIAVLLAVFLYGPGLFGSQGNNPRPDGVGKTVVGQSLARARDSECINNLGQIRLGIQVFMTDAEATKPASLDEVRGIGASMKKCPVGDEPYAYDAATGVVRCVHKGHERY